MTRLTGAIVLALLIVAATFAPLHAAPPPQPARIGQASDALLQTATPTQTTTVQPTLTPEETETPTPRPTLTPEDTETPTDTATPTETPTATATETPTPSPSPTATLTPSPSPTPPEPTASLTVTSSPTATVTPTATPTGPPLPGVPAVITDNLPLIGGGCLVILLLATGLTLILWTFRRRKKPGPPPPPPRPTAPAGPYLESTGGPEDPQRFQLDPSGFSIGRAPDNDLIITQEFPHWDTVSRYHARIHQQQDRWIIEDLDSTNGVYVQDRRTGKNLLHDGWQVKIGSVEFIFRASTEETQS